MGVSGTYRYETLLLPLAWPRMRSTVIFLIVGHWKLPYQAKLQDKWK